MYVPFLDFSRFPSCDILYYFVSFCSSAGLAFHTSTLNCPQARSCLTKLKRIESPLRTSILAGKREDEDKLIKLIDQTRLSVLEKPLGFIPEVSRCIDIIDYACKFRSYLFKLIRDQLFSTFQSSSSLRDYIELSRTGELARMH